MRSRWSTACSAACSSRKLYLTGQTDSVVLRLPEAAWPGLPGELLGALVAAGAFAAFMSTASGLMVSVAGTISFDLWRRAAGARRRATAAISPGRARRRDRPGRARTRRPRARHLRARRVGIRARGEHVLPAAAARNLVGGPDRARRGQRARGGRGDRDRADLRRCWRWRCGHPDGPRRAAHPTGGDLGADRVRRDGARLAARSRRAAHGGRGAGPAMHAPQGLGLAPGRADAAVLGLRRACTASATCPPRPSWSSASGKWPRSSRSSRPRRRGEGRARVIEGPAGIGKSALLADARRRAARDRLRGAGAPRVELEREFPFGVVRQLFEARASPTRRARARARRCGGARRRGLRRAARRPRATCRSPRCTGCSGWRSTSPPNGPLFLAIDDLHWCDRPSLRFVAYLARRLEGQPILVAATVRTRRAGHRRRAARRDLPRPGDRRRPPDPAERRRGRASSCASGWAPRPTTRSAPPATAPRAATRCSCASCSPRSRPTACGPTPRTPSVVLEIGPRAVSRTVIMRLARLSEDAIAVARAVAVLATAPRCRRSRRSPGSTRSGWPTPPARWRAPRSCGREPPIGFVHALVRDAVYQELPLGERELQHERAARVLRDAGRAGRAGRGAPARPRRGAARSGWPRSCARRAARRSPAARPRAASPTCGGRWRSRRRRAWRPALLRELGLAESLTDGPAAVEHLTEAYERLEDPSARARRRPRARPRAAVHRLAGRGRRAAPSGAADGAPGGARGRSARADGVRAGGRLLRRRRRASAAALRRLPRSAAAGRGRRREDARRAGGAVVGATAARAAATSARRSRWPRCAGGELTAADNGLLSIPGIVTLVLADRPRGRRRVGDRAGRGAPPRVAARDLLDPPLARLHAARSTASWRRPRSRCARRRRSSTPGGSAPSRAIYTGAFHCARADRARAPRRGAKRAGARPARWSTTPTAAATGGRARSASSWSPRGATRRPSPREEYAPRYGHVVLPTAAHWRSTVARALDRLGRRDEAIALAEAELADARRWGAPGTVGPSLRALGVLRRTTGPRCSRRRWRCSSARTRGSSTPRRSPTSAPRCAASGVRATRASRCGARSSWPTRARRGRARRARARRALRDRRAAAHDGARRRRRADGQRAPGGGLRGRRPEQPRHRAGAVRDAQDRRGPPEQRLPQARDPLAPRAGRSAGRPDKDWGRRLGVPRWRVGPAASILCA